MAQAGILRFENVAKSFGGTQALKGVSFEVNRGEVVALLGEDGAGKSTLIKVLGGIVTADSGAVSIDGEPYRHRADARQRVAFVHQDLGLIEWMTVAENMALAHRRRSFSAGACTPDDRKALSGPADAQFVIGNHHMLAVGRARDKPLIVGAKAVAVWALNREIEVTVEQVAELNIG